MINMIVRHDIHPPNLSQTLRQYIRIQPPEIPVPDHTHRILGYLYRICKTQHIVSRDSGDRQLDVEFYSLCLYCQSEINLRGCSIEAMMCGF
ncbi:hypothetical protein M8J77_011682 [Diaphorina citri]|nr:hypothetical protein M8J77_011682 [Diaphorina citri]